MTVLAAYAYHSLNQTKLVESLLREAEENATSKEEFRFKFTLARQKLKERGNRELPGRAFGSE